MKRGISFLAKSTVDNDLYRIFKDFLLSKFCNVAFFEGQEDIELYGVMEGEDFLNKISDENFYAYFLELFVFNTRSQADTEEINNYDDFLNSNCELAILIYDSIHVEIYCKDESAIEAIKCKLSDAYENVEYITDLNDIRTEFSVF